MAVKLAIAYDGSSSATAAVRACGALFDAARAAVVTVPDAPPPGVRGVSRWVHALADFVEQTTKEAESVNVEGVDLARAAGLEAAGVVTKPHSPTWEAFLEVTRDIADVLVCGSHGRSELSRTVLGSTSTRLLHHAELPLLVVPEAADASPGGLASVEPLAQRAPGSAAPAGSASGPVLIAYDGSAAADRAIDVVGALLPGREVTVVHVWASQYRGSRAVDALARREEVGSLIASLDTALAEDAAEITERGVARATAAGLRATGDTVEASVGVWRTIASLAREQAASLVVTGRDGSALLGSVSSGLVHNAHTPVLVTPTLG